VFYAWLLGGAGYLVSVAITSLLLLVVYAIVPNTLVRWRAAAAGAVLAAVLLELGKYGFKLYLDHAGYKSLYGSLALVPLFLLWVYITWVVVLFGLRSAYLIQHGKRLALFSLLEERAGPGLAGSGFADPGAALLIMQQAASAFARGTSVDVASLASATALPQGVVERAVTSLCDAGLLLAVAERSGAQRVTLARPAETIALGDVLNVGHGLVSAGAPAGVMGELRRAQAAALAGRTLAELVEAPAGPAAKTRAGARTEASQAVQTRADDGAVGPAFQEVARAQ
jgi:membrane protein